LPIKNTLAYLAHLQVTLKMAANMTPQAVFRALHFLNNFRMGLMSWSVTLYRKERLHMENHSSLLGTNEVLRL
jgi:hypothetical protein